MGPPLQFNSLPPPRLHGASAAQTLNFFFSLISWQHSSRDLGKLQGSGMRSPSANGTMEFQSPMGPWGFKYVQWRFNGLWHFWRHICNLNWHQGFLLLEGMHISSSKLPVEVDLTRVSFLPNLMTWLPRFPWRSVFLDAKLQTTASVHQPCWTPTPCKFYPPRIGSTSEPSVFVAQVNPVLRPCWDLLGDTSFGQTGSKKSWTFNTPMHIAEWHRMTI
jgi:hypothetical protein